MLNTLHIRSALLCLSLVSLAIGLSCCRSSGAKPGNSRLRPETWHERIQYNHYVRRDGEIGRRSGLKIRRAQKACGGSIPPPGTNLGRVVRPSKLSGAIAVAMLLSVADGTEGNQIRFGIVSSMASEHLVMHFEVRRLHRRIGIATHLGGVSPDAEPHMRPHQGADGAISIESISGAIWPKFLETHVADVLAEIDKIQ